jgi:hypothetical protein
MAGFVDATVREIDSRLQELREEITKLEAAKAALTGPRRGPGRPRRSASSSSGASSASSGRSRRPGRPRGRRGGSTRANQALDLVKSQPGITIPQIAEALSIEPNYLYRVMPKLVAEGSITRSGQGWHPVGSATES